MGDQSLLKDPPGESVMCWICDYGLTVLAVLVVLIVGLLNWPRLKDTLALWIPTPVSPIPTLPVETQPVTTVIAAVTPSPNFTQTAEAVPLDTLSPPPTQLLTALPSSTSPVLPTAAPPTVSPPTAAPSPTSLPGSQKPIFVLVMLPVNWNDMSTFPSIARSHADLFIEASNIEAYFTVEVKILNEGIENADLTSNELVYDIMEFGLQKEPGDRYVGITTGDISLEGNLDVAGWTTGGQAVVSEDWDVSISAHELGHTFGLCDEYNYAIWKEQDAVWTGGCPNPYPPECPLDESLRVHCDGALTDDGAYSIMGPAGLIGDRGYNTPCYSHLHEVFEALANSGIQ